MIRRAAEQDIEGVARIYGEIHRLEQAGKLTTGWISGIYPVEATARRGWQRGELYVDERDGVICAAAILNGAQGEEYSSGNWQYPADPEEVLVLHTLVVDPAASGKGIGAGFVAYYENLAQERGCRVLRMDTNARNLAARRLYARLGYREAGIVPCVFNGIPDVQLVLLEKRLAE